MSRHFLVDGYNVIHKVPELVPQAGKLLEDSRDGLIRFIVEQRPHGSLRNSITVVFDGSESVCALPVPGEVRVLFSRGETADDLIKRLIEESANPREMVLVSDDRDLQFHARAHAVDVWGVERFVLQGLKDTPMAREKKARRAASKTEGKVISEVFKDRVNRELERIWCRRRGQKD